MREMRLPILLLIVTLLFLSLSACSSKPTEADARKVFENLYWGKQAKEGILRIILCSQI